jgi:D-alanyl-D-alanine carboxypeptidase (penicillin-binding protein 5/6)
MLVVLALLSTLIGMSASASPTSPARDDRATRAQFAGSAAIAVDLTTGIELFAVNPDDPLQPASTIKIVTALVAVDLLERDTQIVVEDRDLVDPTVFSNMGLMAGDTLTVHDLLAGLLIQSAGDAALALARGGGLVLDPNSVDPVGLFVQEMNTYAASIGMTGTSIANPIGADDAVNQRSTARDLVRATQRLMDDWLLSRFVATDYLIVNTGGPNARQIELNTSNGLLERSDVFGVKTGTEDLAGQCLITGFWRGDNQIIVVVLGSADRYADTLAVMEAVDNEFRWVALGQGTRSAGASDALAAQGLTFITRRTVIMRAADADSITWEFIDEPTSYRRGEVVFTIGERQIARLPVY